VLRTARESIQNQHFELLVLLIGTEILDALGVEPTRYLE
jgi:hypothetical protein